MVPRLECHLARLARSAAALGIRLHKGEARDRILQAASDHGNEGQLRLRLHLSARGALTTTAAPFRLQSETTVWRLAVAGQRLNSRDPLRRHKSDQREVYERARAEHDRNEVDEVLLLNERGEIAEGTITNLFLDPGKGDGVLLTPPLESGCLPGIEREAMLASGRAREQPLLPKDLRLARALFVGNALRGLIQARLVGNPRDGTRSA